MVRRGFGNGDEEYKAISTPRFSLKEAKEFDEDDKELSDGDSDDQNSDDDDSDGMGEYVFLYLKFNVST